MFRALHIAPGRMELYLLAFAFFLVAFVVAVARAWRRGAANAADARLPLADDTRPIAAREERR